MYEATALFMHCEREKGVRSVNPNAVHCVREPGSAAARRLVTSASDSGDGAMVHPASINAVVRTIIFMMCNLSRQDQRLQSPQRMSLEALEVRTERGIACGEGKAKDVKVASLKEARARKVGTL